MSDFNMEPQRVFLNVDSGVCRFKARIECWMEDGLLRCSIVSGCKHVQDFATSLEPMEMMDVLHMPFSENKVYIVGGRTLKHTTCPLPMAVLKGFEVAAGLALKRDVIVTFDK
jgi:Family of unknown function (DUF6951)